MLRIKLNTIFIGIIFMFNIVLTGCYHKKTPSRFQLPDSIQQKQIANRVSKSRDSIDLCNADAYLRKWHGNSRGNLDLYDFRLKHHYSQGYNFVVRSDSLMLKRQQPEEFVTGLKTDSFPVNKGKSLVVADIRIIPNDSIDSVWINIATEDCHFGWIREKQLLSKVDPDDPISKFISLFSNTHLIIFLIVISLISIGYLMRTIMKRNAPIVVFNDINSLYPSLLVMTVATAATFYATIQLFASETWREFYFNPSLNPFSQPLLLKLFLLLVWGMLLLLIASLDDIRRLLKSSDAILYLSGLAATCAVNYIIFSVLTLYYIGYMLLIVYLYYVIRVWVHRNSATYICGNCGKRLHRKGRCPHCGVINE